MSDKHTEIICKDGDTSAISSAGSRKESTQTAKFEPNATLHDDLKEVFVVYEYIMNGSTQIQDLESSDVLRRVHDVIEVQKAQQASMPTPKLWIQFMNMMDIVRKFLRSERTGN